jgi:hypothetical protein
MLTSAMKRLLLTLVAATALSPVFFMQDPTVSAQDKSSAKSVAAPYKHIVLLKFKDDASSDKVKGVVEAFKALKSKLPAVQTLEWGPNISPEKHNQGFTHCFTLGFESKEALEKHYLNEPAHKEFGALLGPVLDKVLVVDFLAQ